MGYTTDFDGTFTCTPALNESQIAYLKQFAETRRMARDPAIASTLPDPLREAVGLPIGEEGEFFVGGGGSHGQGKDASILNYNSPAKSQPGLWCQWVPTEDGNWIEWDGGEKFYNYVEWIKYLNEKFLKPWGIVLDGKVSWSGEESSDVGVIVAKGGKIRYKEIERQSFSFEDCDENTED
jgi:hypothetical protein